MGTIDGKPGLWAGVELSGGFAGKGKNNGSVAGSVVVLHASLRSALIYSRQEAVFHMSTQLRRLCRNNKTLPAHRWTRRCSPTVVGGFLPGLHLRPNYPIDVHVV